MCTFYRLLHKKIIIKDGQLLDDLKGKHEISMCAYV